MVNMKEAGFTLLVILVTVSAIYQWSENDPTLNEMINTDELDIYNSITLRNYVENIEIKTGEELTVQERTNPATFIVPLIAVGAQGLSFLLGLLFGWIGIVEAIFNSSGLAGEGILNLAIIFIPPLVMIEILALIYFVIDLKKAIPFI